MQASSLINKQNLQYLIAGVVLLVVANIANDILGRPYWAVTRFIHLGADDNISAWYSSILLVVAGLISYECSIYAKNNNTPGHWPFLLFAGLLGFMSADEVARFHEVLGKYVTELFEYTSKSFTTNSPWVWIGGPVIVVIFIGFAILLKPTLSLVPRSMFFLALGLFSIILGGVIFESTINFLNHEELQWVWDIEIILEEFLEMIGTVLISYALIIWRDGIIELHE